MKVEMLSRSEDQIEKHDYNDKVVITIDGQTVFTVQDGEPEDNYTYRNFNDVYDIPNLLRKAYEAGVNGEEFQLEVNDLEE